MRVPKGAGKPAPFAFQEDMVPRAAKNRKQKVKAAVGPAAAEEEHGGVNKRPSGRPINRLRLVRQVIRKCTEDLDKKGPLKSGVAELIRLLALEKELAEETETVSEIKVTWVEPTETESSKSK